MLCFMLHFGILYRYIVVLCVPILFCIIILLFCNVTMQFFVILYHLRTIYRRFVCNNIVLYLVM